MRLKIYEKYSILPHCYEHSHFRIDCPECVIARRHYTTIRAREAKVADPVLARYYTRRNAVRLKIRAMKLVTKGGKIVCANCGCDDIFFLEINHINGGGSQGAKTKQYNMLYEGVIYRGLPTDSLNILCRICNALDYIKRKYPNRNFYPTVTWKSSIPQRLK